MKLRIFTKNIIIITVILIVIFLSQKSGFKRSIGNLYSQAIEKYSNYGLGLKSWLMANIYPMVGRGADIGKEVVEKEVVKQKDVLTKNFWKKFKNYLAEKFSKISGTKVE